MVPGKHESTAISAPILPRELEFSLAHEQRCRFLIKEQCSGHLAVENIPGNTVISATILPKEREFRLAHAQKCNFLIMEQCSGSLAVKIGPGNHCDSEPILPRERELRLEHVQRCSFLIMEQSCGLLAVEIVPGKHCDFSTYLAKRARAQSGACAEVQFPDYGTALWSPGSRKYSIKALRFQHLNCKESESSDRRMRRGEFS
jgi:hypothetical protein